MSDDLRKKAASAAAWSIVTELAVKIVTPVTQLLLARILAPEAFGVVATVTMITSFADMLSDSGFQKYLIQHDFKDDEDLYQNANVAFWSNMIVSLLLWLVISIFREQLAVAVGNPGLGIVLVVACSSLPLSSFSSIQLALFRRALDFRSIMPVRIAVALVPLVVTLPLALLGFDYWSLIIGTIVGNMLNATALTLLSPWKPGLYYSFLQLRDMFAFSGWTLLEAIVIWATSWAGTFVVGGILNPYYLGLYKQPMTFVNSAFGIITNATTPVLFSSLSKLQDDMKEYRKFFYRFQFNIAMLVLPLGVGIFFFRDYLTRILLGEAWLESSLMLGCWGLSQGFMIVFAHYCSEVFRSLGKPKVSLFCQSIYLAAMVPTLYFAASTSFIALSIASGAIRLVSIVVDQIVIKHVAGITSRRVISGVRAPLIGCALMGVAAFCLVSWAGDNMLLNTLNIAVCILVYTIAIAAFPEGREFVLNRVFGKLLRR